MTPSPWFAKLPSPVGALAEWSKNVRNLTAHPADSVLVGLDFPTPRTPQMRRTSIKLSRDQLALAFFTSRWPILLEAVPTAPFS